MDFEEIGNVASWAVDLANEYRISVSTVTEPYKDIRKSHSKEETKKMMEDGFELIRGRR